MNQKNFDPHNKEAVFCQSMMYRRTENSFSSGDFCRTPGGVGFISDHPSSTAPSPNRYPRGIEFIDEIGGCADGFVSCTESLGFESSDERIADEELGEGKRGTEIRDCSTIWGRLLRRSEERRRAVEFPPPLTSLDKNGRRNFILRPVRTDGRLELTEVKIRRPEIMYATRENGRLTLRLIETPDEEEQEQEDEIEEEEEEERTEEAGDYDLNEEDVGERKAKEEREGGGDGCECRSPASGGEGGKALRRCYEYEVAGHQHLNVWSPRVATTM